MRKSSLRLPHALLFLTFPFPRCCACFLAVAGIIVIGVLLLLIAFLGCWGALKENRKLLIAFFSFVLFFVVIQFGVGIAAYVMKDDIPLWADQAWSFFYANDRSVIDTAENQFKCCGYTTTSDRAVPPNGKEASCAQNWYKDRGSCSTAINDNIQLLWTNNNTAQATALAANIQATEQCCGWVATTDPLPWGIVDTVNNTPCPSNYTTPCYTKLNATWVYNYNLRSAAGDNYIINYENAVGAGARGGAGQGGAGRGRAGRARATMEDRPVPDLAPAGRGQDACAGGRLSEPPPPPPLPSSSASPFVRFPLRPLPRPTH